MGEFMKAIVSKELSTHKKSRNPLFFSADMNSLELTFAGFHDYIRFFSRLACLPVKRYHGKWFELGKIVT